MYTWWIIEVKWIFLLLDTEEAYVCNIIRLIVIVLAYQNLHRPKYCWNTNLWPYWFKRLPHSMQNWYFVTAVVGNKIWTLPKTWMVFLVLNLGYNFYNILKAVSSLEFPSPVFLLVCFRGVSETLPWQSVAPLRICFILQVEGGFSFCVRFFWEAPVWGEAAAGPLSAIDRSEAGRQQQAEGRLRKRGTKPNCNVHISWFSWRIMFKKSISVLVAILSEVLFFQTTGFLCLRL